MLSPTVTSSLVETPPTTHPFTVCPPIGALPVCLCHLKDDPLASQGSTRARRHVTGAGNDQ